MILNGYLASESNIDFYDSYDFYDNQNQFIIDVGNEVDYDLTSPEELIALKNSFLDLTSDINSLVVNILTEEQANYRFLYSYDDGAGNPVYLNYLAYEVGNTDIPNTIKI